MPASKTLPLKEMTAPILVTGAAGFIGFHLTKQLLKEGSSVVGIDNLNDYYDVHLKKDRLAQLERDKKFTFVKLEMADRDSLHSLFSTYHFDVVLHMAAQAGVRYSLENPMAYAKSNLIAFLNLLEECRYSGIKHLLFASSSSVYGGNKKMPLSVRDNVDHPLSFYAVTKKSNELMAHSYAYLYNLPCTGLRFFTAYGPWGRPDMALFLFTRAILANKPIKLYNYGRMRRDFTYVDDIVDAVLRLTKIIPQPVLASEEINLHAGKSFAPYRIYNVGRHQPIEVPRLVDILEKNLGKRAHRELTPAQPGDVSETFADIDDLCQEIEFDPKISIEDGVKKFVDWYLSYYKNDSNPKEDA